MEESIKDLIEWPNENLTRRYENFRAGQEPCNVRPRFSKYSIRHNLPSGKDNCDGLERININKQYSKDVNALIQFSIWSH